MKRFRVLTLSCVLFANLLALTLGERIDHHRRRAVRPHTRSSDSDELLHMLARQQHAHNRPQQEGYPKLQPKHHHGWGHKEDIHVPHEPVHAPHVGDEHHAAYPGRHPIVHDGYAPHFPHHHYHHGHGHGHGHKGGHHGHGHGPEKKESHYHEGADHWKTSAHYKHHHDLDHGDGGKKGEHKHHGKWNKNSRNRHWVDKDSHGREVDSDRKVGVRKKVNTDRNNWDRDKEGGHERVWNWDRGFGNKKRWHHHLGDWLEKDQKGEKKRWNEEEHAVRHVEDRAKKHDNQKWVDQYHNEKHHGYGHHDDGHRYNEKKKQGVEIHRTHREKHSPKGESTAARHGGHHNWEHDGYAGHDFDFGSTGHAKAGNPPALHHGHHGGKYH